MPLPIEVIPHARPNSALTEWVVFVEYAPLAGGSVKRPQIACTHYPDRERALAFLSLSALDDDPCVQDIRLYEVSRT